VYDRWKATYYDIADGRVSTNIVKSIIPSGFDGFVGCLGDSFGVAAYGVRAGAIAAVETAY
jgi:hypothetical protein